MSLAGGFPVGYSHLADIAEASHGNEAENSQGQTDPPIFGNEDEQNPYQQQKVSHNPDHKLGEEHRNFGHIAIDPLNHLSGSMLIMKRQIELQAMPGQVGPEPVGSLPPHIG